MRVVVILSGMVSGIAAVLVLYMLTSKLRRTRIDMRCVDTIAHYLLYTFIIDFSLEMLDLIHRIYEADESLRALDFMVHTRLYFSQVILQISLGTLLPICLLGGTQLRKVSEAARKGLYVTAGSRTTARILARR